MQGGIEPDRLPGVYSNNRGGNSTAPGVTLKGVI